MCLVNKQWIKPKFGLARLNLVNTFKLIIMNYESDINKLINTVYTHT